MAQSKTISVSQAILKQCRQHYDLDPVMTPIAGGFQNAVFTVTQFETPRILRLTPARTRATENIAAELEFINYLHQHGLTVAQPILSRDKKLVTGCRTPQENWTAVLFTVAPGNKVPYPDYLGNTKLYELFGALTGNMHHLSMSYHPKGKPRHLWRENFYLNHVSTYIPQSKTGIHEAHKILMHALESLVLSAGEQGLIHGDLNVGNMHLDGDTLTLFDFDECQMSAYVEDIAIALYYTVFVYGDDDVKERDAMGKTFMKHFLKGYRQYRSMPQEALRHLELYLKVRELIVHVGIYRRWDFSALNPWQKDYLRYSEKRIEQGLSIINSQILENV